MSWSDNFPVYLDNLSTVCTASVLIAVFALFVAHYYQSHDQHKEDKTTKRKRKNSDSTDESSEERDSPCVKGEFGGAFGKIKAAKQEALLKSLQPEETEEQKLTEKRAQEEQMKAIWNLLQKQEEKFKVGSKEELEDQLKLYRR